jgi:hypothetical protein
MQSMKNATLVAAVALGLAVLADSANGQCVQQPFTEQLNDPEVALIFHGTVTRITVVPHRTPMPDGKVVVESDQIVSFEVQRTWKGSPRRNLSVYNMSSGSEGHAMIVGRQYLVFAYLMSPEGRKYFGLPETNRDALIAGCDLQESSNPYADGLTNNDPGVVSR